MADARQYTPAPVPSTGNAELERYVSSELELIRNALPVPVYGGLSNLAGKFLSATTTPQIITGWGGSTPAQPQGCILNTSAGTIDVNVDGTYICITRITAAVVAPSQTHNIELYANGAGTGVLGQIFAGLLGGTSPQGVVFEAIGLFDVSGPTQLDLRYYLTAGGPFSFILQDMDWTVQRIGG